MLVLLASTAGSGYAASGATPNGEAAKAPDEIIADAQTAAVAATAVRISGSGTSGGSPLALDLHLLAGKGGAGHVLISGLSFDIVRIGPKAYFKAGAAFWRKFGGNAAAQLFKGKWLMASATTGDLASFTPLTDIAAFMKQLLGSHGTLKLGGTKTLNGRPVIAIIDTGKDGGTLYISATGKPYPLELASKSSGTIKFTGWDHAAALHRPKGAIDYAELTKKK